VLLSWPRSYRIVSDRERLQCDILQPFAVNHERSSPAAKINIVTTAALHRSFAANAREGLFTTGTSPPQVEPLPLYPISDAKSEPWRLSRRVTAAVAVSPCNVPLWWSLAPNGSYVFFVRRGWKPVEFEKGKPAIAVPSLDKLPSVIDTLITAVRNDELDQQLAQASKQATPQKTISGQRDGKFEEGRYATPQNGPMRPTAMEKFRPLKRYLPSLRWFQNRSRISNSAKDDDFPAYSDTPTIPGQSARCRIGRNSSQRKNDD
jgi:hypothetical protein